MDAVIDIGRREAADIVVVGHDGEDEVLIDEEPN